MTVPYKIPFDDQGNMWMNDQYPTHTTKDNYTFSETMTIT